MSIDYDLALHNNYKLIMDKKEIQHKIIGVGLPDLSIGLSDVPHHGGYGSRQCTKWIYSNKIEFGELTISFLLDEDYEVYFYFMDKMFDIANNKNLDTPITLFGTSNKKNIQHKLLFGNPRYDNLSFGEYTNSKGVQYRTINISFKISSMTRKGIDE